MAGEHKVYHIHIQHQSVAKVHLELIPLCLKVLLKK